MFDDDAVVAFPEANWARTFGQLFGRDLKGKDRLNKNWYDNSIMKIVETKSTDELKKVRYWIDCGDDDFLYEGNSLIHIAMRKKEIPHEFRIRDGGHSWVYWRTSLPTVLEFVSQAFHQF